MSSAAASKVANAKASEEVFHKHAVCLVLDYGSQYTQLIARRVRENGVLSVLLPGNAELSRIEAYEPKLVILSGGPNSVHAEGSPKTPDGLFDYCFSRHVPILGICYGMQLLVHELGGTVSTVVDKGEYGRMPLIREGGDSLLFGPAADGAREQVWMSHGDSATQLPAGFRVSARSEAGALVAIEDDARGLFGLQYHPEVRHTERGTELLRRVLFDVAKIKGDWRMEDVLREERDKIARLAPSPDDHVICALSGGVDSAVAATLAHGVLGDRLHCVFVDNGLLRKDEAKRVMKTFETDLKLPVTLVDDSEHTLGALRGLTDPELKRKAIGARFIEAFRGQANRLEKELGARPRFLLQGTLYPDVIESAPPPGSGQKAIAHTIKSHHNVGGLPEDLDFALIEPLRELYKDEVRELGRLLGVPDSFVRRHPFPGPGLAVRVLGDVTLPGALETLRDVDEIYVDAIREFGFYDDIWQAFAVFLPLKTVGVQGDQRSHSYVVALRAVTSADGMTADWFDFPASFLREVSTRICNTVRAVNRVVYDITSKPPGTIEWE